MPNRLAAVDFRAHNKKWRIGVPASAGGSIASLNPFGATGGGFSSTSALSGGVESNSSSLLKVRAGLPSYQQRAFFLFLDALALDEEPTKISWRLLRLWLKECGACASFALPATGCLTMQVARRWDLDAIVDEVMGSLADCELVQALSITPQNKCTSHFDSEGTHTENPDVRSRHALSPDIFESGFVV
eukprot:2649452-Pleurochrysis_carterae.AAC.1